MPPTLAVTLGDPRGIGPEITRKALHALVATLPAVELFTLGPAECQTHVDGVTHLSVPGWDGTEAGAGRAAVEAIRRAVEMVRTGGVRGIVTAPIHKPALRAAGCDAPGHTELLRDLSGAPDVGMLMAAEHTQSGPPLRILLATTHLPLREVPQRVTEELLVRQTRLLDRALREGWNIEHPRIGLCALNPHASDRGLFGDEEARIFEPARERLAGGGVDVQGPVPADTVFHRALDGEFDAVVAPYHDVGMAAFKTVSFGHGVNVTLGLPFVRTSPDHGTAFDLVGRDLADPTSMGEALWLAARLVRARFDTAPGLS